VAYFFGSELHRDLAQPVGLICSEWGGTRAEAWIPRQTFDALKLPYEPEWTETWLHPKPRPAATQPEKVRPYEAPSTIYNAMIAPIVPFAIKGVVWYQGETNTAYPVEYRRVLASLVTSWRSAWTRDDIPFLIVQLPNYESSSRDWVALRKSQEQVSKELSNVALAITIDLGDTKDPKNIHPPNKAPVGHRLALLAEKLTYGKDVQCYGPTVKLVKVAPDEVMVAFEHADGLKSKGDVKGFEIAGEDGKFVPATGKIDGERVILSTVGVTAPRSVRYGWTNNPTCTLYNEADLPAVPFEAKHD
jgi:sialate O-acetylesterase